MLGNRTQIIGYTRGHTDLRCTYLRYQIGGRQNLLRGPHAARNRRNAHDDDEEQQHRTAGQVDHRQVFCVRVRVEGECSG